MTTQSVYFMHYSDGAIYCSSCKSIGATTTGHGKSQTHKIIQTEYYLTSAFILTIMARWDEEEDNGEGNREKMPRSYYYKEGVIRFANPNQRFKCDKCDRPATHLFFLDTGEENNTFIHKDMIMHVFCDYHDRENYLIDHLPYPRVPCNELVEAMKKEFYELGLKNGREAAK